jgi:hypothetical protein
LIRATARDTEPTARELIGTEVPYHLTLDTVNIVASWVVPARRDRRRYRPQPADHLPSVSHLGARYLPAIPGRR